MRAIVPYSIVQRCLSFPSHQAAQKSCIDPTNSGLEGLSTQLALGPGGPRFLTKSNLTGIDFNIG